MKWLRIRIEDFLRQETAAVSVDFVAITALLVGLGIVVLSLISAAVQTTSEAIDREMRGIQIRTTFGPQTGGQTGGQASGGTSGENLFEFGFTDPTDTGGTIGNPGNDKTTGGSGENPNGTDDWGSGTSGQSN